MSPLLPSAAPLRDERGLALPLALFLLVETTLLAHALWVLAELEVRIAQAEIRRVSADYGARAQVVRRADSLLTAGADSLALAGGRPDLRRVEVVGEGSGVAWAALVLIPTPRAIMAETGTGAVVGQAPDAATASRIVPDGSCPFPQPDLYRNWAVDPGRPPTLAGVSPAEAVDLLPELTGPWHSVLPDSAGLGLVGGRAGPLHLDGEGAVLIAGGTIRIKTGADLSGVLISTAGVELETGARFEGLIVALGGLRIQSGGWLRTSSCAAESVLTGSILMAPRRIGPVAWPVR